MAQDQGLKFLGFSHNTKSKCLLVNMKYTLCWRPTTQRKFWVIIWPCILFTNAKGVKSHFCPWLHTVILSYTPEPWPRCIVKFWPITSAEAVFGFVQQMAARLHSDFTLADTLKIKNYDQSFIMELPSEWISSIVITMCK